MLSQGEARRVWLREKEQSASGPQSAMGDFRAAATIGLDKPTSASNRSSSSRSSLYSRRRVIAFRSVSGNLQTHARFGAGPKAARDMPDEAVVLSQDMFLLRKGAKQRLARELVGRLYVARNQALSCSSLVHKRSPAVRDLRPDRSSCDACGSKHDQAARSVGPVKPVVARAIGSLKSRRRVNRLIQSTRGCSYLFEPRNASRGAFRC